jgi:hypothetical protein
MNKLISKMPFLKNIKDIFNQPEVSEEYFRSAKMMSVLFDGQSTKEIIMTLTLFDSMVNDSLIKIQEKASNDKNVTEYYLKKYKPKQ